MSVLDQILKNAKNALTIRNRNEFADNISGIQLTISQLVVQITEKVTEQKNSKGKNQ